MKRKLYLFMAAALFSLGVFSLRAQGTGGTDFWLTFGANYPAGYTYLDLDLQIRIVSGDEPVMGTIYFTNLNKSEYFSIGAQEVFPYPLDNTEKQAVLNTTIGKSNRTIHITSNATITVYALNQAEYTTDATNVLPVQALDADYYQISYTPSIGSDAYAIVAIEDNTQVLHNDILAETLDAGEVYYRTNSTDMTGHHITANHPVAFFAVNPGVTIPNLFPALDCLFQQLAPVNTWGKTFFVPATHLTKDRVRIVASQNGTNITQTGGTLQSAQGSQMSLTGLQAGQFVELEINLNDNGCYILSNYPVGVCSYLVGCAYNGLVPDESDPAQAWIPAIEQTVAEALVAPFVVSGSVIDTHRALIISSTATKNNTQVSVNGGMYEPLSGGIWKDHPSGMSYYTMPMEHDPDMNYHLINNGGIIVMCYGTGPAESYYYLGFSAMRNLAASFYANDIYYQELSDHVFCTPNIDFHAEVIGLKPAAGSLKWYIDGVVEPTAQDQLDWSKTFSIGDYEIKMWALFSDNEETTITSTLHIGADIIATPSPPGWGSVTGAGCYKAGATVNLTAIPNPGYLFVDWTENGMPVETNTTYSFPATEPRTIEANFKMNTHDIIVIANPATGDNDVTGGGTYPHGTPVIVTATADTCYIFVNWTKDGVVVSTSPLYLFSAVESCTLTANFVPKQYVIITLEDPDEGGETYGGGAHDCGAEVTVTAVPAYGYDFVNWTEDDDEVANTPDYTFIAAKHRILTAHFEPKMYDIELLVNPPLPLVAGNVFGAGSYPYGENITVSAIAEPCYIFINWTEDNEEVSNNADYTFTVTKDRILIANFERKNFDVIVLAEPTGGGEVHGGGSYPCDSTITVWAEPADCYEFENWTENGVPVCFDPIYEFTVTEQHILYANFVLKTFDVEVEPNPDPDGGIVTINSADGVFECGATAIVKAYANPCYTFVNWTKNGIIESTQPFHSFIVTESCTLVANFALEYYSITVSDNPSGGGNPFVECDGGDPAHIPCGESVIAHAMPNPGYDFIDWTENGVWVSDDVDYEFTVTESRHLVANFSRRTYEIIVLANPPDGGDVTGGGTYNEGDIAKLMATANPCYDFINWTEDGNEVWTYPPYEFPVTESRTLTANFQQRYYDVVVSAKPEEYGEVSGGGEELPCGDSITVTATAIECYEFVNWTENGKYVSDENPYTFELTKDRDLVANFKLKICNVIVYANPSNGGTTSGNVSGITCGDTITITATPAECYKFLYWTEDDEWVSDDPEYEFIVLESHVLVANFEWDTFTIKLLSNPLNGGILSGDGDYSCKEIVTVTATPDECYTFLNWTEDDVVVSNLVSYTFTVTENRTLVANFEQQTRSLALYANPPNGGFVSGDGDYPCGENVTASAIHTAGYVFVNWTEYGGEVSPNPDYPFPLTTNRILVANFTLEGYQIITTANPTEGGTTTGDGMYYLDDPVTVKATAYPTYKFINWTEDGEVVSNNAEFSFTVTESRTLVANFDILLYNVIAEIGDGNYGYTTGSGWYAAGDTARLEVFVDDCYRFANWTIDDKIVSYNKLYAFEVTEDVTVTANFNVLDFDTYAPTLWNNTFMLNLRRLEMEGYDVTDCVWYKNGDEEEETHTINAFSYSAGPAITDLLETAPTWYKFKLITSNRGDLCSTHKTLTGYTSPPGTDEKLVIYPNPVLSGNSFTVEGVVEGCTVLVYNQYGICVRSVVATKNPFTITLDNVQPGSYLIRADGKQGKVVIY